jgi:hypothetical protein
MQGFKPALDEEHCEYFPVDPMLDFALPSPDHAAFEQHFKAGPEPGSEFPVL